MGWIKLHRKTIESRVFANEGLLKVWVWCLLKANHSKQWVDIVTGKGKTEVEVLPGQFIFGRKTAGKELKMKPETVRSRMEKLKKTENITMQSTSHYSIVSIVNWDTYQKKDNDTHHVIHQPDTNQTPTIHQPDTTDKKDKKEKKDNKNKEILFPEWMPEELKIKVYDFIENRKAQKSPMTEKAIKLFLTKIEKLSKCSSDLAISMIDEAIINNWKSIYEPKTNKPKQQSDWRTAL